MENDISQQGSMLGSAFPDAAAMDFDPMDDLLLDGCWLEMTDCSDFLKPNACGSTDLLDSPCFSPSSDVNSSSSNPHSPQNADRDDKERLSFAENPPSVKTQTEDLVVLESLNGNTIKSGECLAQSESCPTEESRNLDEFEMINRTTEASRRWWIEPRANPGPASSVKERVIQALRRIKDSTRDGDVLVQIWVPVRRGGRRFLTTCDQPFSLDPNCQRLVNYRTVSINYLFSAEEDSNEAVGLPGRVFLGKLPEWTPDVRYFSSDEYPRVSYAHQYDVRGTLALPIFEQSSQSCLGVVEVVMTTTKVNYRSELENICNALQAVNLRTSEVLSIPHVKVGSNSYQVVLPEILEVLRTVCETHRLPLAQTWVPCIQQGKEGCRHSDENYTNCVSTWDIACYGTDPRIWGFHEACSEHHLFRGQGVVGKAFTSNQPCFSTNITAFSKTEYPLSHYARMFGLRAAVAIRLRSIYTGLVDYVLELFLPVNCTGSEEQKLMLSSLSVIIQQLCRSLRVITEKELEQETIFPVSEITPSGATLVESFPVVDERSNRGRTQKEGITLSVVASGEESSWITSSTQAPRKGECTAVPNSLLLEFGKQEPEGFHVSAHSDHRHDSTKDNVSGGDSSFRKPRSQSSGNAREKKRTKTEKTISLQVLQQYFAGNLKDAAKSIGVCPTTLKRICRQHGITRWPSRKIKKVGHSLRKLKVVIDSVQGSSTFSTLKQTNHHSKSSTTQAEGVLGTSTARKKSPSSSCSQTSSSSLSCSTMAHQNSHAVAELHKNQSGMLKRAYSEAELHDSSKEEQKPPARSHSHKSLSEHPSLGSLSSWPKPTHVSRDDSIFRVKVAFGEENIRFRLHPSWGFQELQQEIAKRFSIDDTSMMDLKYLDDDSEWVLLTCDADLHECKDVYRSSGAHAMKLSIHHVAHPKTRNSLGQRGPS
ncbi:protein NLP4-like isoform X2 [Magnolia sinica]|uniref:protein NLP4-like isoform X2 n=1 Tax=Magnolia sinica TaxID=86752 RepID=UPI00265A0F1B|nr:protein NLP4-like isoform X2 [Magnolia sinica]